MATITPTAYAPLSTSFSGSTAGQSSVGTAAAGGGDTVPLIGSYVKLTFRTAGTGSTITLDSVSLSSYGADQNITVTMAATDSQDVLIKVDERFKQTSGNVGNVNITYTSVTTLTVDAKYLN
jgi:hypothetical protein